MEEEGEVFCFLNSLTNWSQFVMLSSFASHHLTAFPRRWVIAMSIASSSVILIVLRILSKVLIQLAGMLPENVSGSPMKRAALESFISLVASEFLINSPLVVSPV
ncbi:hypothetical protein BCR42DRAFT_392140 [Absidia repens]|uniref:Uncharacterized protein n=1 Tax=Absidia repens TaxID=90262 RepID=A0A1X2IJ99_9FUNG|nr:hypothetical protein BCR42DRAFT_392140 [Absidia repens]